MDPEEWSFGRRTAEAEANLARLKKPGDDEGIPIEEAASAEQDATSDSSSDEYFDAEDGVLKSDSEDSIGVHSYTCGSAKIDCTYSELRRARPNRHKQDYNQPSSRLLALPAELIDHIFQYLGPYDLETIGRTCHKLQSHSHNDFFWLQHVQDHVPGVTITSPMPCASYRELWCAHDPYWFLTKHKIWFSDLAFTGKLIVARYDPRRGCIEAHRVVTERPTPDYEPWEHDQEVLVHTFRPRVKLHLDIPVLQLNINPRHAPEQDELGVRRIRGERKMDIEEQSGTFANLFLTREAEYYPGMQVWPPVIFPSDHRVRNHSQTGFRASGHVPTRRSEISQHAFRIRKWMRMSGLSPFAIPAALRPIAGVPLTFHTGPTPQVIRQLEDLQTFATLDPKLYTPTSKFPWRGIWVGDYSGHGCEYMLMHQPELPPFDIASVQRRYNETSEEFERRKVEEEVYRGSIAAIKLTGDPNIPRGENTFVADDIGKAGFVRIAEEAQFRGARIVESRGHIAERFFRGGELLNFQDDKYIDSQLIMISHNQLAQYWLGFGHISFFERVDIDQLIRPTVGL